MLYVALLAEGVDRNSARMMVFTTETVALLAEGVDRNKLTHDGSAKTVVSPSSRRAWIEISAQKWRYP